MGGDEKKDDEPKPQPQQETPTKPQRDEFGDVGVIRSRRIGDDIDDVGFIQTRPIT